MFTKLTYAVAALGIAAGVASMAEAQDRQGGSRSGGGARTVAGPSNMSATGDRARSSTAETRGANKRGFCPPGQAKKGGRGSAFNC